MSGTPADVDLAKFYIHIQGFVIPRFIAGKVAVLFGRLDVFPIPKQIGSHGEAAPTAIPGHPVVWF